MKTKSIVLVSIPLFLLSCSGSGGSKSEKISFVKMNQTTINDPFWSPKMELWSKVTANDVFNKFEGKHMHEADQQGKHNVFDNFDRVAKGQSGTGGHVGLPWFDGLIYETIRGISDFLDQYPDKNMEQRIDDYIDRIVAAQQADPNGYIETYTELMEPTHRWGENGGFLRWQHDIYNAGMLIEAGVHYYKATGKVKLLSVATRLANYMYEYMGPAPKKNLIPSHSGPEEAVVKLYRLYKENPELKAKIDVPVNEDSYFELVKFWIEDRGNHCGFPLWAAWGNEKSERWIKDQKYNDPKFGNHSRASWGHYAQDSVSVFEQKTIEGHAVRATLLATGITALAIENHDTKYIETATHLWDNMVGKRMFVTGGVGAIHDDEKFGPDYFLPTDAYLETCAAVGAGFFSQRMNELTGDGKYMDEFERVLYNNVLTGISLSGDRYTYQNPLNADKLERWEWHSCPCCPPMFLKMVSAIPEYIYSFKADTIYTNLFISSETQIMGKDNNSVSLKQETQYPWDGKVALTISPDKKSSFSVMVRIPGWAQGKENPYELYRSNLASSVELKVNGKAVKTDIYNGYAAITREWNPGDKIELSLPMQPRIITANDKVTDLNNLAAIASGPIVYCLEGYDNAGLEHIMLDTHSPLESVFTKDVLNGVNVIKGKGVDENMKEVPISAIPYFAVGNRQQGSSYKVWIPLQK